MGCLEVILLLMLKVAHLRIRKKLIIVLQSWQNLDKIAKSPPLAEHMKTIQIATIHHLPHYSSFEAWYEQHEDLFNSNWQFTDSYPMGEPFSHMSRQPKAYFKRYQRWRSGEKTMINHWENGTAPTLQLNLLKRLYMVEPSETTS